NHRSGLIWWRAYFKKNWKGSWLQRRQQLSNLLQKETCKVQKTATYSDVDYLTLGFVLETLLNKNLLNCWQQLNQYFPSNDFHFLTQRPQHNYLYAPTFSHQKGHKWVQALVNDANTQAFGGISSHAGLFGQIEDVSTWLLSLRESLYKDKGFVKRKTLKHFMKRSMKPHQGDWALGFMLPGKNSTSGKYFSKSSIGHLGFTGTSFWWDPKKDVFIVLLANRYINSQKGEEFRNLRPLIHNEIMELI
ncbi:MAG: serine hydrolase, partial [Bdellovibrionales bacterium]|nr:serine hydrolase [Bdellovibrionales bacterium]